MSISTVFNRFLALFLISLSILSISSTGAVSASKTEIIPENILPNNKIATPDYGKFPLLFESNLGQTDRRARYIARTGGYQLYLMDSGVSFSLNSEEGTDADKLEMNFAGANPSARIEGAYESKTKTNYYTGKKRFENISNFQHVFYRDIYKGVDAFFYGVEGQTKYDLIVAPNVDPSQIKLKFDGAESIRVTESGELHIKTANAELTQKKPYAYQDIRDERVEVPSDFKVDGDTVTFDLGGYDSSKPLVIDPVISYLTYVGGNAVDRVTSIEADLNGNAYIFGETDSLNFHGQSRDERDDGGLFAAKINSAGTAFDYVTILDGRNNDLTGDMAIDAAGNAYLTGIVSKDFPTTSGAFDENIGGGLDAFAAKLSTTGTLVYSTYIGGSQNGDHGKDIAVDAAGRAYIAGETFSGTTFPKKNEFSGCGATILNSIDIFLTVLNSTGSDITYSTCIGGANTLDSSEGVVLDAANNAYIIGTTFGDNFPVKNAFQTVSGGREDAVIMKFNPAQSGEASLIYSSYLGGGGTERGAAIAVNPAGQAHVTGVTGSLNFPLKNPIRSTNQINEAFVTVVSANGTSLVNSTFLGGAGQDIGQEISIGPGGLIYVGGDTQSSNFPTALPFQPTHAGSFDAFVTKMKFGTGILSSSFLGGSANDFLFALAVRGSRVYVAGQTSSNDLQATAGAIKTVTDAGAANPDGFVAKIIDAQLDSVGIFRPAAQFTITQSTANVGAQTATFTQPLAGARGVSGDWNGDDIDTIGSFTDGVWKVRDVNFPLANVTPKTINFGQIGDLPVAGDWNGDGIDTPGVFRPGAGQFFLTNSTAANPTVDATIVFGVNGDLPVAGEWNADGIDSVGVFRPADGTFFLADENVQNPPIAQVVFFGTAEDLPLAGDFDANGFDTVGVWRPSTLQFFLSNDNVNIDRIFAFGQANSQPMVGDWDGRAN